jgi:hypothetical protein
VGVPLTLGQRLTRRSGREALVRLVVAAAAVAVGIPRLGPDWYALMGLGLADSWPPVFRKERHEC